MSAAPAPLPIRLDNFSPLMAASTAAVIPAIATKPAPPVAIPANAINAVLTNNCVLGYSLASKRYFMIEFMILLSLPPNALPNASVASL